MADDSYVAVASFLSDTDSSNATAPISFDTRVSLPVRRLLAVHITISAGVLKRREKESHRGEGIRSSIDVSRQRRESSVSGGEDDGESAQELFERRAAAVAPFESARAIHRSRAMSMRMNRLQPASA